MSRSALRTVTTCIYCTCIMCDVDVQFYMFHYTLYLFVPTEELVPDGSSEASGTWDKDILQYITPTCSTCTCTWVCCVALPCLFV